MFSPTKQRIIDENNILLIGKHKGRVINDVLKTDPAYCVWLSKQPWSANDEQFLDITRAARNPNNPIMTWGRHKGKPFSYIIDNDPKYIEWMRGSSFVAEKFPELKTKVDNI
jgi:uncharacterized protein (DUF3820 family)